MTISAKLIRTAAIAASISLLSTNASAQVATTEVFGNAYDAPSGVLTLPDVGSALRQDPRDSFAVRARGRTASIRGPWFNAGADAASLKTRDVIVQAGAANIAPSAVLLPVSSVPTWTWTSGTILKTLNKHPSASIYKTALGVKSLTAKSLSAMNLSLLNKALVSQFTAKGSESIARLIHAKWPGIPVVIVDVSAEPASASFASLVRGHVSSSSIMLGAAPGTSALESVRTAVATRQSAIASLATGSASANSSSSSNAGDTTNASGSAAANTTTSGNTSGDGSTTTTGSSGTTAGGIPPTSINNSPAMVVAESNGRWSASTSDGTAIFSNWTPTTYLNASNGYNCVTPRTTVTKTVAGIQIQYTYENNTNTARELASITMPTLTMGDTIKLQDVRTVGGDLPMNRGSVPWYGTYPRTLYSPTAIIRNSTLAVGLSIEYPVLEYRHDVRLRVDPRDSGNWNVTFGLENAGIQDSDSHLFNPPVIQPGETRSYRVNIAFAQPDHWIETIAPYRDYFQATYGMVAYVRDQRPVAGVSMAMQHLQSSGNPYGWVSEAGKPEIDGYGSAAQWVSRQFLRADRVMVWTPTGLNPRGSMSYPYQFASHWNTHAAAAINGSEAPQSPANLLIAATGAGQSLGLWWGRSANVERSWGDTQSEALDPNRADHLLLAWNELDQAVAAGAQTIGLDAFAHCYSPVWNLTEFLKLARIKYPNLKFISEGRSSDILHVLTPTWTDGYRYAPVADMPERIPMSRFVVADYLVPGHETWAGMCFDRSTNPILWGPNASLDAQLAEVRDVASLGYVPVSWLPIDMRQIVVR
jgi:hypothetical protein